MRRIYVAATAVALVAAACSGGSSTTTNTTTPTPAATTATTSTAATTPPATASPEPGNGSVSVVDGWELTEIGSGTKPVLALNADAPGIAYILERQDGFVAYADEASGWQPEPVVEGYFYGPIGIAYDPSGVAHIAYHDHQASSFQQDLGDLTLATRRSDATWAINPAVHDGHDGWDSTIAIGPDGIVRAAGIDPVQFGSEEGVEYYELGIDGWQIDAIGTGPVAYEFNVALAIQPDGEPALTYYDTATTELRYAARTGNTWSIETVDEDGDVGRYSSLAFDTAGTPHVAYYELLTNTGGAIRYATLTADGWIVETIDTLDQVRPGFTGARRIASLAVDSAGVPHVAYSDEAGLHYATRTDAGWDTTQILTPGDSPLGQLVSLAIDTGDQSHITFFELTEADPIGGVVYYLTTG